jgi:hypothetical protein
LAKKYISSKIYEGVNKNLQVNHVYDSIGIDIQTFSQNELGKLIIANSTRFTFGF